MWSFLIKRFNRSVAIYDSDNMCIFIRFRTVCELFRVFWMQKCFKIIVGYDIKSKLPIILPSAIKLNTSIRIFYDFT